MLLPSLFETWRLGTPWVAPYGEMDAPPEVWQQVGAVAGRHRDRLRSDGKRAGGLGARPGRTAEAAAAAAGRRVRDPLATARVRGSHRVADVGGLVVARGDGARDGGLVGIAVGRVAPVVGLVGRRRTTVGRGHDVVDRLPLVGHRVARDPGVAARAGRDEVPRAASGAPEDVVLRDGRAVGVGRGPGDRHLGVGLAGYRRARAQASAPARRPACRTTAP